jgi:hypothetical protein
MPPKTNIGLVSGREFSVEESVDQVREQMDATTVQLTHAGRPLDVLPTAIAFMEERASG